MIMKNDLEELVRERLKLPENAVINSASFRITYASEEIELLGKVAVEFTLEEDPQELDLAPLVSTKTKRGKKGPKVRRSILRDGDDSTPSNGHALPGKGAKITDAQVKGMKAVLHARKATNKLSDNQLSAMKALEGVRLNKMTPEMRQQLKDIHDESTPQRGV